MSLPLINCNDTGVVAWDLVIVGAGWQGIAIAKTYQDLYPDRTFVILDSHFSIGGTWAVSRTSPLLKTQNTLGSLEYSFYSFSAEKFGVLPSAHIPGHKVQQYLQCVTEKFDLLRRTRFGVKVLSATPIPAGSEEGWSLRTISYEVDDDHCREYIVRCKKLVVATGLTSTPRTTDIAGSDAFLGDIIGYQDLSDPTKSKFLHCSSTRTVTVIGGSKSGHDAVYWSCLAGKKVHWVVPRPGNGIAWMTAASTRFMRRDLVVETLATTRVFSWFSPCIFGDGDGFTWPRWLLHRTKLGPWLVRRFWRALGDSISASSGIERSDVTAKAKPDYEFQWQGSSAGTLNYDSDFYALIDSGQISIERKSVESVKDNCLRFTDGSCLQTDAIVHCGGWKWARPILFHGVDYAAMGLPKKLGSEPLDSEVWARLRRQMDKEVLHRIPDLRSAPAGPSRAHHNAYCTNADDDGESYTPWCLHRTIAPLNQVCEDSVRTLAFTGLFSTLPTAALAEIQALWSIAFLHHKTIPNFTSESAMEQAVLWSRWNRLRYPYSHASQFMDTAYDILPYFDIPLADMGLRSRRKTTWWKELWEPYGAADYKGPVEEFKARWDM